MMKRNFFKYIKAKCLGVVALLSRGNFTCIFEQSLWSVLTLDYFN
jgi:hypothetical protein